MNHTKLGLFALVLLFGATILVPVLLTGTASAECSSCACNTSPALIGCAYDGDVLHCDACALRDYDQSAARDTGQWTGEYTCNLCGCGWTR